MSAMARLWIPGHGYSYRACRETFKAPVFDDSAWRVKFTLDSVLSIFS
jgi:hypothetical protein